MDLGGAVVEHVCVSTGGILDVLPRFERHVGESHRGDALLERARQQRQVARQTLQRAGARRGFGVPAPDVLDVLARHREHEVDLGEVDRHQLAAPMPVDLGAERADRVGGAPAHREPLDHVGAARADQQPGRVGEERAGDDRARRVPGAERDDVRHPIRA